MFGSLDSLCPPSPACGPMPASARQRRSFRSVVCILMLLSGSLALDPGVPPANASPAPWGGQRLERDGVLYVHNPAEPMEPPQHYEMVELWRLESTTSTGELLLGGIEAIEWGPDGFIYMLDYLLKTVHIIQSDGMYVRSIGRAGEGPGEFGSTNGLVIDDRGPRIGVSDYSRQRITFLSLDGLPAGEWLPQPVDGSRARPYKARMGRDRIIVSCRILSPRGDQATLRYLSGLFDEQGALVNVLFERRHELDRTQAMVFDEETAEPLSIFAVDQQGRTLLAPAYGSYEVHCFDSSGVRTHVIMREYDRLARTPAERESEHAMLVQSLSAFPNSQVRSSAWVRDILQVTARPDGCMWVESSRGWRPEEPGVALVIDQFDEEGRFARQAVLHGPMDHWEDFVCVHGDTLLRVTSATSTWAAALASPPSGDAERIEEAEAQLVICYRLVRVGG